MTLQDVTSECGEFEEMVCTAVGPDEAGAPGPELAAGCRFRARKSARRRGAALMGPARHRVPSSRRFSRVRYAHTPGSQSETSALDNCVLITIADGQLRCTLSLEPDETALVPQSWPMGTLPSGQASVEIGTDNGKRRNFSTPCRATISRSVHPVKASRTCSSW
jgi:hypothetical protein